MNEINEHSSPVEKMAYWANRVLDGDDTSASGSFDLDYAHDMLTAAAKEYLA